MSEKQRLASVIEGVQSAISALTSGPGRQHPLYESLVTNRTLRIISYAGPHAIHARTPCKDNGGGDRNGHVLLDAYVLQGTHLSRTLTGHWGVASGTGYTGTSARLPLDPS
jgi:hypothetical protein